MNIIAIDDEKMALEHISSVIHESFMEKQETIQLSIFRNRTNALEFVETTKKENQMIDYAFVDIHLRGTSGLTLAKEIKKIYPDIKIVIVSGYSEYAYEAYRIHAAGYILKPVTKEEIMDIIEDNE